MDQNIEKYPYFSDGEILTAGKLNNMVDFLHGQAASVSQNLLGYGIIRGFGYTYSKRNLLINPGCAVFPDGTFYSLEKSAEFNEIFQTEDGYVFSNDDIPNLKPAKISKIPSDIILALEKKMKAVSNHCNQTSCDIYNPDKEIIVRPILLYKKDVLRRAVELTTIQPCGTLGRLGDFHSSLNFRTLMKATESRFRSDKETLLAAMKGAAGPLGIVIESNDKGEPALSGNSDLFLSSIVPDWKSKANRYVQAITKLSKLNNRGKGSVVVPQYFLSFLKDLHDALNEFIIAYNEFALKYKHCVLPETQVKGKTVLILGGLYNGDKQYRTTFHPVQQTADFTADAHVLDRMFTRILLLSEKFIGYACGKTFVKANIQLVPSGCITKLGDRPIPYYYKNPEALEDVWQADRMAKVTETLTSYNDYVSGVRTAFSFGEATRYTLEGAYDKNAVDVLSAINDLIDSNRLDLSAKIIKIPNFSMAGTSEHPGYYQMILNAFNKGNKDKLSKFNIKGTKFYNATAKHEPEKYKNELQRTEHTRKKLLSLFKIRNMTSLLVAMKDSTPLPDSEAAIMRENLAEVSTHEFKMLYKYMKDNDISNRFVGDSMSMTYWKGKYWRIRAVAAFSKLRDFVMRTYHPALKTSVTEGVGKHGTINLLSYKGKVVFVCYS